MNLGVCTQDVILEASGKFLESPQNIACLLPCLHTGTVVCFSSLTHSRHPNTTLT